MPLRNPAARYYSEEIIARLKRANGSSTFEELFELAVQVVDAMPENISIVCGPISSGGHNSLPRNIFTFDSAISMLDARGENVFTQLPFEAPMQLIKQHPRYFRGGTHLLEAFYLPLFKLDKVTRFRFIPKWETSFGAKWEHDLVTALGKEIKYLRDDFTMIVDVNTPLFK